MAKGLKIKPGLGLALACLVLFGAFPARGAFDPTRPPPGLAETAPAGEPVLQAPPQVGLIFRTGKTTFAVVDGMEVKAGDRFRDGRVIRIDEAGVWLHTPQGKQLLRLLPAVKKQPAKP